MHNKSDLTIKRRSSDYFSSFCSESRNNTFHEISHSKKKIASLLENLDIEALQNLKRERGTSDSEYVLEDEEEDEENDT